MINEETAQRAAVRILDEASYGDIAFNFAERKRREETVAAIILSEFASLPSERDAGLWMKVACVNRIREIANHAESTANHLTGKRAGELYMEARIAREIAKDIEARMTSPDGEENECLTQSKDE